MPDGDDGNDNDLIQPDNICIICDLPSVDRICMKCKCMSVRIDQIASDVKRMKKTINSIVKNSSASNDESSTPPPTSNEAQRPANNSMPNQGNPPRQPDYSERVPNRRNNMNAGQWNRVPRNGFDAPRSAYPVRGYPPPLFRLAPPSRNFYDSERPTSYRQPPANYDRQYAPPRPPPPPQWRPAPFRSYSAAVRGTAPSSQGCTLCGEPNHGSQTCRHGFELECHHCGQLGHKKKACPNFY